MARFEPHILAIPLPAQGHINPLMRLCKIMATHGFAVTFVNVEAIHNRINDLNDQAAAATNGGSNCKLGMIRSAHIPVPGLDMVLDSKMSLQQFCNATENIAVAIEPLIERLGQEGRPVTCIISDLFLSVSTQDVADKFNIPRIAFCTSSPSISLLRFYLSSGEISWEKSVAVRLEKPRGLFVEGLPGLAAKIINHDMPTFKHGNEDATEFVYRFVNRQCEVAYARATSIVVNSFDALEGLAMEILSSRTGKPVYGVGPLEEGDQGVSTSLWKEEAECLQWLEQQPAMSVLYVSFGSLAVLSDEQFQEILCGLQASRQRFLWVLRPGVVESPATAAELARTSTNTSLSYVVKWAPQLRVLSHPSVAGFLTHCGWNSTTEAIACGVPMLCWPHTADQFFNAKYIVEEWKVGLRFLAADLQEKGVVGRDEVQRVVTALVEGQEGAVIRQNAARLRQAARKCLQEGGSSYNSIHALVSSLRSSAAL